jgi:membrane peptidoglycan carboxypeptidase
MASAYATLAASGVYCQPLGVLSISSGGQTTPTTRSCSRALPVAVADTVTSLLAGVVANGTGTAAQIPGHPIAGKTGTTSDFGSAWFIGYTPQLATAVWMGDPRGSSYPLTNVAGVAQVFGGTLPAEEFATAMGAAIANDPPWAIPQANQAYLAQPVQRIPDVSGLPVALATNRLRALGALVTAPSSGTVTTVSPPAGSPLTPGESVTLQTGSW